MLNVYNLSGKKSNNISVRNWANKNWDKTASILIFKLDSSITIYTLYYNVYILLIIIYSELISEKKISS